MEQGLLSRLQGYFSTSYGGRYAEYVVKEVIEEQPKLATVLFGVRRCDVLEVEYRFRVAGQVRIADPAFLDAQTERPTCLVEIKYEDHKSPRNAAQLADYLRFCRQKKCTFILLTQHLPPTNLKRRIPRGGLLLYSDLADKLPSSEGSVGALLRRFFVDRGLVMHDFQTEDLANLKSLLYRLLNPWLGSGRSQRQDAMGGGGVADAFGNLLRNMNLIAKEVASNLPGRPPTIDFELDPWVRPNIIRKIAAEDPAADSVNAYRAKHGGCLYVYGRVRLDDTSKSWLQVEFGIGLKVNPGERNFHTSTFAVVYSNALGGQAGYSERATSVTTLSDKRRAVTALRCRIHESIEEASHRPLPRSQLSKLRRFGEAVL